MSHYGNELKKRLITLKLVTTSKFVGCTSDEINEIMQAQNISFLPKIYQEFLETMGKNDEGFLSGMGTFHYLKNSKQNAISAIDEYNEQFDTTLILPNDAFVFLGVDDFAYFYFRTGSKNDDPPVRSFLESQNMKWPLKASLTLYFNHRIEEMLKNAGQFKQ